MKIVLRLMAFALVFMAISCKDDDPVYPSLVGTTWDIYVKWNSAPDTVLFYTRYDAGGAGVEVDGGGTPTGVTFTWTQDDDGITWTYPPGVMVFTGTTTTNGSTMTGTAVSGSNTAGWRAVKQ